MRKITMWSVWLWMACAAQSVSAAEIKIKQFQAGDVISAADVNGNFQALAATVQQLQASVIKLENRNKELENTVAALQAEIATLKTPNSVADPISPSKTKAPKLRSTPKIVSEKDARTIFGLNDQWRPLKYIENDFEVQGDVVIDHATGLMWQKADSKLSMNYKQAQVYINRLNRTHFAGYADWRLPTVDELLSLVEFENHSNGRRINSVFIITLAWYCSADIHDNNVWNVNYNYGNVNWTENNFVRAVRSLQP